MKRKKITMNDEDFEREHVARWLTSYKYKVLISSDYNNKGNKRLLMPFVQLLSGDWNSISFLITKVTIPLKYIYIRFYKL